MFLRTVTTVGFGITAFLGSHLTLYAQTAQDAAQSCAEASRLIEEDDDIVGALDEAQWCLESLRQIRQNLTLTLFPDSVDDFSGGEIDNQSAMGMSIIKRAYERNGQRLSVSLTSGIAGDGLAALAQFASGLAGTAGNKLRIQKRTVIDMSQQTGKAEFVVQLKSGGVLNISSDDVDVESVLEFIRSFPVAELDDSIN